MSHQLSTEKSRFALSALIVALARAALIGALFFHAAAWAGDESKPQIRQAAKDAAPRLDFGSIPLGTPIALPPQGAVSVHGCNGTASGECGFGLNGIRYGTHWGDSIVVNKVIDVGDPLPVSLPFGLHGDETIGVALESLNAQFNGAFEIARSGAGEDIVIAYSSNERVDFEVSLSFQRKGRLSEVRGSCCYD